MTDDQAPAPDDASGDEPREGSGENRETGPETGPDPDGKTGGVGEDGDRVDGDADRVSEDRDRVDGETDGVDENGDPTRVDPGGLGDAEAAAEELRAARSGDGDAADGDVAGERDRGAGEDGEGATPVGDDRTGGPGDGATVSGDPGSATGGEGADAGPADDGAAFGATEEVGPVPAGEVPAETGDGAAEDLPEDVRKYARFKKMDGAQYERVNDFLRERTYVTAREWAIARLCADFRTETGVEMTKIGENLPELVPFMEDTYSPQAVNQARSSFEEKVRKAGATFLYGAMCDFFTAEELDDLMYEVTEVAKFLLEVEGVDLSVDDELAAEDRISGVMREVRQASEALRYEECPNCGHDLRE